MRLASASRWRSSPIRSTRRFTTRCRFCGAGRIGSHSSAISSPGTTNRARGRALSLVRPCRAMRSGAYSMSSLPGGSPPRRDAVRPVACAAERPDRRPHGSGGPAPHSADVVGSEYRRWVEQYDRLSDAEADRIRNLSNELASRPPISVVMALGATREPFLAEAIASIRAQANPHWELSIAHDERTDPDTRAMLDELCRTEARVKLAATPAGSGLGERIRAGFALTS